MNDNLDDFLSSLGIAPTTNETVETSNENLPVAEQPAPEVQELQSLTNSDIDDILSQNGFSEAMFDDAQEMAEEESGNEEEEENTVSAFDAGIIPQETPVRDLDAEEDADWQEAIDFGILNPTTRFVGTDELTQDGDMRIDPHTGEIQMLMDGGVINVASNISEGNLVVTTTPVISEAEYTWDAISPDRTNVQNPEAEEETNNDTTLPKNSPTLLLDDTTSRFSGAEWYNEIQKKRIIVAGIGGIGSWLSLQLARMHPEAIFMYDEDTVELANMSGQLYSRRDAGRPKVAAIFDTIQRYTSNSHVYAISDRYTSDSDVADVMMCGFDNMAARKIFFNKWLQRVEDKPLKEKSQCLYLDGIMKCLSDNL